MTRLTENVYVQDETSTILDVLREAGILDRPPPAAEKSPVRFVHVVNTYDLPERRHEQDLTFSSMKTAKQFYETSNASGDRSASALLVGAAFPEDMPYAARHFSQRAPLERSALDLKTFHIPKKLPLLFDIVEAALPVCDAGDYLIYTNSDICVSPSFYEAIATLLRLGFETVTVNRRTIEAFPHRADLLPLMAASRGKYHQGFDCFVFPASWTKSFVKVDLIVGMPGVARGLLYNIAALAQRCLILKSSQLTFHIGDDKPWQAPKFSDYREYNWANCRNIFPGLDADRARRLADFCRAHAEPPKVSGV